jgi:hypothetical protein
MAVTNTWGVVQLDCYPELEGQPDVVFTVHWNLIGTETVSGVDYSGYAYGSVGVALNEGSDFIPYADLTEADVIGWVQDALGADQVASYEDNVAQQIANKINPPVVAPPLPWASTPA